MPTPVSHSASYCSPAEFIERVDYRNVADFLDDNGNRLTKGEVLASTVLLDILKQASGELESECFVSGHYTVADLLALTGNSLQLLKGVVAGLALPLLWDRRPQKGPPELRIEQWAKEKVGRLRGGEAIFGLQDQIDAGVIDGEPPENAADVEQRNLVSFQAERFFGRRSNRWDQRGG